MQQATRIGMNRTGTQMSPMDTTEMTEATERHQQPGLTASGDETGILQLRTEYIREADPLGSVPPPGTLKGAMTTGIQKLTGRNPEVLIDKLGERLAFERSGVRLYEAFMAKCQDQQDAATGIPIAEVEHIRDEEARHFAMLTRAMESLGADPTAMTPSADAIAVASMGLIQLVTDPRSSTAHGLEALLAAELTDNASWELLVKLAEQSGQDELAEQFREAMHTEEEHLVRVKGWLEREVMAQAT